MTPFVRIALTPALGVLLLSASSQAAELANTPTVMTAPPIIINAPSAPTVVADAAPVPEMSQRDLDERLWLTALTGNFGAIVELVGKGANPNVSTRYGETAMHAAAARGHLNIVNFLLKKGVSVHARTTNGWTPLHHAARFGHASVANLLVQHGANPRLPTNDAGKKTPIEIAVDKGDLRMARIMGW